MSLPETTSAAAAVNFLQNALWKILHRIFDLGNG
jgi:hypothetical protein